jgi:hypothetical protein
MGGAISPLLASDREQMSKIEDRQRLIRQYQDETGETELDMPKVVAYAVRLGWPLPKPRDPMDVLLKEFSDSARQKYDKDAKTGRPYRVYHAVPVQDSRGQGVFVWVDINDPRTTAKNFRKSAVMRREQMVDDGVQLSLDLDHWNSIRPPDDRITLPMDISPDIEWRKNSMDDDDDDRDEAAD